ncbi:MAG: hypothetical protein BAX61_13360 [Psychrobacter sp. B29-1]|uniref:Rha family transcriptional regulator n=1 Tax=Psychrobacter sp. B29-1 TaxID=1867800 RepID=UPI000868ABB8|nr:phage antirepressor KilAC domain-containing protein [Psychrobacter sp. B29-1]OEH66787.1 MAG: hypothetical protein BAX61_13360 [Psychrobacter sp. B29-1]
MQNIMQVNAINKTMSSREIAKLADKQHGHVIRDIELLNETLAQESLSIIGESFYTADNGQTYREFLLTKEQTIDLMTGYNRNLRVRINRRWAELEAQASSPVLALPDFTNPALAARAWADEYQAKQIAQEQLAIAAPKAAALDTLSHAKGSLGIRETANTVGIPERKFIARCTDENKPISSRFMYRDDKNKLRAYAHRIKQGFMTQKITSYAGRGGKDIVTVQVKFTAAGVAHVAKLMQNKPVNELRVLEAV